ncbi:MAG: hypothetical protein OCD02_15935 [Spirochaetaceae bacterium]
MMKTIYVSATGKLKQFIPQSGEIRSNMALVSELKDEIGIPTNFVCGYMVNGAIKNGKHPITEGDNIKFLMLVGAG